VKLLASGRDGDIYEYAPGLVLRKTRDGRSIEHEARIIEYVAQHNYPVPAIHEVRANGSEIIMERVDGPLMFEDNMTALLKTPKMFRLLADLHDQLHEIPAPDWVRVIGDGDRLLHVDLHPLNVIMSPTRGPVVIDWSNAARGDPLFDVGLTYILLTCPTIPVPRPIQIVADFARGTLARQFFARRYRGPRLDEAIVDAASLKVFDRNMQPEEIARMERLIRQKQKRALG
jgi:aminoglycoside phosphotransferase (APT) family kinase protein